MQAWQIEIPEDNLLRSELSYWYKWHEMCFILFDLFVDECELNWSLNNYNGYGGHSEDVRLGNNGEGSFTYVNDRYNFRSNIKFRYNQGQNVSEAVSMLVRALNWQCADYLSAEHIKEYSKEYSINVDFTTSGYKLAQYFNDAGCRMSNGKEYKFIAGVSVSLWKAPPIEGIANSTCDVPQLEMNWIYVASEWLDGGIPLGEIPYFRSYSDDSFSDYDLKPFDFNMTVSHEFGHQYDAKFLDYSIDRESNTHMYTGWQYYANTGRYFYVKRK